MSVSSLAATSVAFRIPQAQTGAQSSATQQSGSTQGVSRGHHHHGSGKAASLVTADSSQTGSTAQSGSLLDVLI